ncbi:MAG: hypothetical protein KF773_41455 [Deltaproteobacteria bacterium]|nr:hypothetical protein [Deltaproteobacteria bacterium]MBX3162503.1 hypothetical protein [Deltaproteobacteria bacterium]MCW5801825.1 hypothetical protein [Deltaproteobacteria bacterium]
MTLLDEAKQIRNEVLHLREGAGRRFGSKLRNEILDWVARAEESGMKFPEACRAVGVMTQRVNDWRRGRRDRPTSRSARAAREESLAMIPVNVREVRDEVGGITFGAPSGHTVSGLTLDQAIGLLRVFS